MTPPLVAVIPARSGSERLANKNHRPFRGKPLIRWTIDAALEAGFDPDEIVVTTDDYECGKIAERAGLEPFARHAYLAQPTTNMREVLFDVALNAWAPDFGYLDDLSFMVLYPTYPLRDAKMIRAIRDRWVERCDGGRLGLLGTIEGGPAHRAVEMREHPSPTRIVQRFPDVYRSQDGGNGVTGGPVFCHLACIVPVKHLTQCTPALCTERETVAMPLDEWRAVAFEVDTVEEWGAAEVVA